MATKNSEIKGIGYACNGKTLTFIKPLVMAIVNITPDSFYDGGKYDSVSDVLRDVEQKVEQGADIIDLGAASSRPGAPLLAANDEWLRLEAVLKAVRERFSGVFISVDTWQAEVARRSADCGADIINDISGGSMDAAMFETVAQLNLPYVLMHIQGTPQTMQQQALEAENAVKEVSSFLNTGCLQLEAKGFTKIILDPGFGFGKDLSGNYKLLKHMQQLGETGYPVLAGVSRKSMVNKVIHTNPVTALNGTTVLNTLALINGASILRVHDVTEARQAIELVEFYKNA